jgi:hypothetical protein
VSASSRLIDTSLACGGLSGVALQGELVSLAIFPEAGGKLLDLVHRPSGFNLLWHNPRVGLARTYAGAPFDDVWCGGWDELFPTDAACELDGNAYHDHGDLWTGPWEWDTVEDDGEQGTLRLVRESPSLPCRMEKWITVRRESPAIHIRHRLTNLGAAPVRFLWNQHVAHAVGPGSRLHLPAGGLGVVPSYAGRAGAEAGQVGWPVHRDAGGSEHDLSRTPPPGSGLQEFFWARELREGWCGVTHPPAGVGLGLAWDTAVFPTVWLFADYGGWRGHHFLLTEACTSPPGSLADAVARGDAATLEGGAVLETEVIATVLTEVNGEAPADERPAGLVTLAEALS